MTQSVINGGEHSGMNVTSMIHNCDWTNRTTIDGLNTPDGLVKGVGRVLEQDVGRGYTILEGDSQELHYETRKLDTTILGFCELSGKRAAENIALGHNMDYFFMSKYPGLCLMWDGSIWDVVEKNIYSGKNAIGVGLELKNDLVLKSDGELENTLLYTSVVHMPKYKNFKQKIRSANAHISEKYNEYDILMCGGDFNRKTSSFAELLERNISYQTLISDPVTTKAGNSLDQIFYSDKVVLEEEYRGFEKINPCLFTHHGIVSTVSYY